MHANSSLCCWLGVGSDCLKFLTLSLSSQSCFFGVVGGREGQGVISRQQTRREDRGVENSMVLVGNSGHIRTQDVYLAWEFTWVNFTTLESYLNKVLFLLNVDSVGTLEMTSTQ